MTSISANASSKDTICEGIYIDQLEIGGMTGETAKEAMDVYVNELLQKEIAIMIEDEMAVVSLQQLGYSYEDNNYVEEAISVGKVGNLIRRYKEIKDAQNVGIHYSLNFSLDEAAVREFIETNCSIYDVKAQNAKVQRTNGQFVYTKEVAGRKLDVDATYQLICDTILKDWNQHDVVIDAVIVEDIPQYTLETVQQCATLLGSYTTNYASSSTSRKNNIANAARLINNSILYPGEVFSCYDKMNPFTTANGYYSAGAYVNGMVEDSIGGGVCQVSTTLYNAVLNAELEVVERAAHSMTVSYVPLSFDAAIAGTYKDLKFKNTMDVPVLVEAIANGTTITFRLYGLETRDTANRRIEYKQEVISKTEPPKDVVTEDPTKPTTYRKVTQGAYTGYVAVLYKYVYENGVLVDKIQVNKSSYRASPAYVTVGTKVEQQKPVEEEKEPVDDPLEEGPIGGGKPETNGSEQGNTNNDRPINKPENTESSTEPDTNEATSDEVESQ